MRCYGLALVSVLLATGVLLAQQPPPPQAGQVLDPARDRLDALLLQWEQQMKSVQTLAAECTRTSVDKVIGGTDVFEGTAKYMRPNLALLEMRKKSKPDVYEKFICTGTFLYEYVPQSKTVRIHELPPGKPGQIADDNFLSFLFGMKAEEAKRRYEMTLVKEDQFYVYIEIRPRLPADKADFQRARLVLTKTSFLPRQLWFEQPNGNEVTWDIPRLHNNSPLNRLDFERPAIPPGWGHVRVPPTPAPRVIRPQG